MELSNRELSELKDSLSKTRFSVGAKVVDLLIQRLERAEKENEDLRMQAAGPCRFCGQ